MGLDFDVLSPTKSPNSHSHPAVDLLDLDILSPSAPKATVPEPNLPAKKVSQSLETSLIDVSQSIEWPRRPQADITPLAVNQSPSPAAEMPNVSCEKLIPAVATMPKNPALISHENFADTGTETRPSCSTDRSDVNGTKRASFNDEEELAFDFRDSREKMESALNRAWRNQNTDVFEIVVPFCTAESLFALSATNKKMHKLVVENSVWEKYVKGLSLSDNTWSVSLTAYQQFLQLYLLYRPMVCDLTNGDVPEYDSDSQIADMICKCLALIPLIDADERLCSALKSVAVEKKNNLLDNFSYAVAHHEDLREYFDAFDVWHHSGVFPEIQAGAFKIYFAESVPTLSIQDAFTYADNLETGEKQTSQRKIAVVFNTAATFLITTMSHTASSDSPLPSAWRDAAWTFALTKVLSDLVIFVQDLLLDTAQAISELEYLHTVIRIFHAAEVLTKNSVLHEKLDTDEFNIQKYVETTLLKPMLDEFIDRQIVYIDRFARKKVNDWNHSSSQRETETEKFLWSSVPKKSEKSDFMSSLKWAFTTKRSEQSEEHTLSSEILGDFDNTAPATEFEAQTAVMVAKLKGMEKLVSFELALEVLEACRAAIQRLIVVGRASSQSAEPIFATYLHIVGGGHIKPAFEKAIKVLNAYDPKKYGRLIIAPDDRVDKRHTQDVNTTDTADEAGSIPDFHAVEPLAMFTELVNIGDLVQQMVHVFFQEELVANKLVRPNNFGTQSVNSKRQFEQMLDDYLAEGLSRGIDVLMDQVEFTLTTEQLGSDYLPPPTSAVTTGQTAVCEKVISLVKSHIDLLRDSTEKSLFDVFQQEVGMRLFAALCKHIKQQTISIDGAIRLISDANAYYTFVATLKQKNLMPFFEALKQVSQLFLIDKRDAKQLGLAVKDSSRYGNVLTTEDILEFVKRRKDWPRVKPVVNKVLYGFLDCVIC